MSFWNPFTIILLFNITLCAICVPIIIIAGYKYNKNRKHIALQKRYANITMYEVIMAAVKFTIDPIAFMFTFYYHNYDNNPIYITLVTITDVFGYALGLFWCWRFWMLRYDIYLEKDMMNDKWKSVLNSKQYVATSWYIDQKQIYGNSKWILKRFILPFLFVISSVHIILQTLIVISYFPNNNVSNIIAEINTASWDTIIAIILLIIYLKMPYFEDNFYILYELKRIIIWFVISALSMSISDIAYSKGWVVIGIAVVPFHYIGQVLAIFTSTYTVNKKVEHIIKQSLFTHKRIADNMQIFVVNNNTNKLMQSLLNNTAINMENGNRKIGTSVIYTSSIINVHPTNEYLPKILAHNQSFEVYMQYVSKDFSMNLLLGFVECIQFQQWLMRQMTDNQIATENNIYSKESKYPESLFKKVKLTDNIPESLIVSLANRLDDDEKQDVEETLLCRGKPACFQLFKKYIEYGSYYEVNLRDDTREEYREIMEHKHDWFDDDTDQLIDILYIFDAVCNECYVLMLDSCQRFQQTSIYREKVQPFM